MNAPLPATVNGSCSPPQASTRRTTSDAASIHWACTSRVASLPPTAELPSHRPAARPLLSLEPHLFLTAAIAPATLASLRPEIFYEIRVMFRNASRALARRSRCSARLRTTPSVLRPLSTSVVRMAPASLGPVSPPVSTALPADSFQLQPESNKAGDVEEALFDAQVQQVRDWWASPRYKGIKRPYSAEDVVSKRGALQQTYPSSLMARKLFNLLEERAAQGKPVHTSTLTARSSHV